MHFNFSFWIKTATVLGLSLTINACSSSLDERRSVERDIYDPGSQLYSPIVVPDGLTLPKATKTYSIPSVVDDGSTSVVDVRPPAQVIALIDGSKAEPSHGGVIYWFDASRKDSGQLVSASELIRDYLNEQRVAVLEVNEEAQIVEADWNAHQYEYRTGIPFRRAHQTLSCKFRYQWITKADGRRLGIQVQLLDIKQTSTHSRFAVTLDRSERIHQSVNELNRLIEYLYHKREQHERMLAKREEARQVAAMTEAERFRYYNQSVSLILDDEDGTVTFLAQANMERTLARLTKALEQMGFTMTDYVEDAGKLYLIYNRPNQTVLDEYGIGDMDIDREKFILTLGYDGRQTRITFANKKDRVLKDYEVRELYPYFKTMLSRKITE